MPVIRLGIGAAVAPCLRRCLVFRSGLHQLQQGNALHLVRHLNARGCEQRRHNIGQFHAFVYTLGGCAMGWLDDERHMDGFVIKKNPVGVFPVGTQRFAVIGRYGNHRSIVKAEPFQFLQELAHHEILVGDAPS
jgi:hypothetical protein